MCLSQAGCQLCGDVDGRGLCRVGKMDSPATKACVRMPISPTHNSQRGFDSEKLYARPHLGAIHAVRRVGTRTRPAEPVRGLMKVPCWPLERMEPGEQPGQAEDSSAGHSPSWTILASCPSLMTQGHLEGSTRADGPHPTCLPNLDKWQKAA